MEISIIGTGYVGLTTGLALASKGHKVIFIDNNHKRVDDINRCIAPFYEDGIQNYMNKFSNSFRASFEYEDIANSDIIFLAVPTPESEEGIANLDYVYSAIKSIGEVSANKVVVIKSTVPVGTNKIIQEFINENGMQFEIASNPEFLSQGTALRDSLNPNRIIFGVQSEYVEKLLRDVYSDFDAPKEFMSLNSAELVKYSANSFQALKIAFINEIATISENMGASIDEVVNGLKHDPVIGDKFLRSGIGFGGSCFPKDVKSISAQAKSVGLDLKILNSINASNLTQMRKIPEMTKSSNVGILGLSFKPGTNDTRETPAHHMIQFFNNKGITPIVYDPVAVETFVSMFPDDKIIVSPSIKELVQKSDEVILATEWDIFTKLTKNDFKGKKLFDGRRIFDFADFQIGRGKNE